MLLAGRPGLSAEPLPSPSERLPGVSAWGESEPEAGPAAASARGDSEPEAAAAPPAGVPGGMFLPAEDGEALWRQTLATVAAEWPVVRSIEPDFTAVPPRPGLIESAWVEPPGDGRPVWPPQRQRVVVRVVPAVSGVWIDAAVQSESLAGEAASSSEIELAGGWQPQAGATSFTTQLAARLAPAAAPIYSLPPPSQEELFMPPPAELPWSKSRFPRLSRVGHKVWEDYRNFYDC